MAMNYTWFELNVNISGALKRLKNREATTDALIAVCEYFKSGGQDETIEASITDMETLLLFGLLKEGVDHSLKQKVKSSKGAIEYWQKRKEAEAKATDEVDKLADKYGGDEPEPLPQYK